jgi:phenylalanyl-tRNA synthetase beta chain
LRTEASYRFERVVDPNGVVCAVDRACELLAEMGQPAAVPGVIDVYPNPIRPVRVALRPRRATELLGIEITPEIASDCLTRLEFKVGLRPDGETLDVEAPTSRADIRLEEDLVEEVGRIYGYENIPETLPVGAAMRGGDSEEGQLLSRIRRLLVGAGLQEVVTHSLTAPSFFDTPDDGAATRTAVRVPVRNALSSEVSGLRYSLLPNLLDVAQNNAARSQSAMALFEIGRVWRYDEGAPLETISVAGLLVGPLRPASWQTSGKAEPSDFATVRGVVEQLLAGLHISTPAFVPLPVATRAGHDGAVTGHNAFESAAPTAPYAAAFHPGRAATIRLAGLPDEGVVGELHPRLAAEVALRDRVLLFEIQLAALRAAMPSEGPRYRPLSPFPAVSRDLAPRVAAALPFAAIEAAVRDAGVELMEEFRLLDVYTGAPLPQTVKSLTLSFTFRSADHTLSDSEIIEALDRLKAALAAQCGAEFVG